MCKVLFKIKTKICSSILYDCVKRTKICSSTQSNDLYLVTQDYLRPGLVCVVCQVVFVFPTSKHSSVLDRLSVRVWPQACFLPSCLNPCLFLSACPLVDLLYRLLLDELDLRVTYRNSTFCLALLTFALVPPTSHSTAISECDIFGETFSITKFLSFQT